MQNPDERLSEDASVIFLWASLPARVAASGAIPSSSFLHLPAFQKSNTN